jgi:very-short-patch-repair endonuclease
MRHKGAPLAELASRQHGVVSAGQLSALGLDRAAVRRRVEDGRLHRVDRGVYAVGHARLTREGRWMAAVLRCGPGAVLSHRSAAGLWGFRPTAAARIDVTVPRDRGHKARRGIVVHRPVRSPKSMVKEGIPVTTPTQTLIDLSSVLPDAALARALEVAEQLRLLDFAKLPPRLAELAGAIDPRLRSPLEAQLLALCRRRELPAPEVNVMVEGLEVDFSWPEQRLVVETDGHRHHGTRAAFERDRERDAQLTAAGWRVVRFTHRRVAERRDEVAELLERLLSGRSRSRATPG